MMSNGLPHLTSITTVESSQLTSPPLLPTNGSPQLPPPPPPPLLPITKVSLQYVHDTNNSNPLCVDIRKGVVHADKISTPEEQGRKVCQWFIKDEGLREDDLTDFVFISSYKPVRPVIQNGPLCGMVALAMAADLMGKGDVSTEGIFEEAKRSCLSLQGEMFSASWMQQLASRFLDCDIKLVKLQDGDDISSQEACKVIIKALLQHCVLLLPYDSGRNYAPIQAKGHKAHWALVTGFFTVLKKGCIKDDLLSGLTQDKEISSLYYWNSCFESDNEFINSLAETALEFKLFAHHGKSKYCTVWSLNDTVSSNANLMEEGEDRSPPAYLLPSGGIKEALRGKVLFIYPNWR